MSVRRVLMTADAVGGVWQYAMDLSSALARYGVQVTIAVMGPPPSRVQRAEASRRGIPVVAGEYRLEWMDDPWEDVARAGEWLLRLEPELRPDVVHLNGYCHSALPWRSPAIVVGHSCVRSWWRAVHGADAPAAWDRYSENVARGLGAAHLVAAPTEAMLRELHRHYGRFAHGRVIPNGSGCVDAMRREPPQKSELVFSAGRFWDAAKNVQALCAAAPHVSWPVYIAGETGNWQLATETSMSPARTCGDVRPLGRLSAKSVQTWYERASIYALPARYEPFGLSVLEAAAAGCALVLGDIPSLRENWSGAALFVDPGDRRALADSIGRLIANPTLRADLAAVAMRRARRFTTSRMADAYLAEYERVLSGSVLAYRNGAASHQLSASVAERVES